MLHVSQVPDTLNGYPVCAVEMHHTCATVLVIRDPENAPNHKDLVVATWSPDAGDGWCWGHYIRHDDTDVAQQEAEADFRDTAKRNARRR